MRKVKETYQQLIASEKQAQLKQLEAQHAKHQEELATTRLDTLARLAGEMAHEVQNPLQFVNNFSEVNLELIEDLQEYQVADTENGFKEITQDLLINSQKINEHGIRISAIVAKLQEQTKKAKAGELELPNDNAHDFSQEA